MELARELLADNVEEGPEVVVADWRHKQRVEMSARLYTLFIGSEELDDVLVAEKSQGCRFLLDYR